jgi:trimethylamine--corrinoid protein Co-methyltransferase
LTQLISPGTPVVLGSASTNTDLRSGSLVVGGPELSQLILAHAQLARRYGIPSRSGGALTDSSYPDAQAGAESMMSMLTTLNSGVDFVLHAGGILGSFLAFSHEKLVLDDEICGLVRRFHQGFVVDAETLAFNVIAEVGPGGNFLMEDHTLVRCRTEFWMPQVFDRSGVEAWHHAGQLEAVGRARKRWQRLVAGHVDPPIDKVAARQLKAFAEA